MPEKCFQHSINEYIYNACEWNGTMNPFEESMRVIHQRISFWNGMLSAAITRIYLGVEYCEKMIFRCSPKDISRKLRQLHSEGYALSFVFPPAHDEGIKKTAELVSEIAQCVLVDEWIVNDIGVLLQLKEMRVRENIVLGRLFDKTIREPRLDITKLENVSDHLSVLQPRDWKSSVLAGSLEQDIHLIGAETDTLPDGMLDLTGNHSVYRIHYPDIYVSSSAFCEWSGIEDIPQDPLAEEREQCPVPFCLGEGCGMQCSRYYQEIPNMHGIRLKKKGNVISCRQDKPIQECVLGDFKLIVSER